MQAVREENEALKQEIEAVRRQLTEQVSEPKILIKGEMLFFFSLADSVFICFKLSSRNHRHHQSQQWKNSRTSKINLDDFGIQGILQCSTKSYVHPPWSVTHKDTQIYNYFQ